jgi:hypothetical protein
MLIGSATTRPPYSVYLLISAEDATGNVQQWAVEGDSIDELRKRGTKTTHCNGRGHYSYSELLAPSLGAVAAAAL